jgi:serine/threonine protein kinase
MTILELCARGSVGDLIYDESAQIGWPEKVTLCQRIAQGLAYLHAKGVLHRDREYLRVVDGVQQGREGGRWGR